jgi:hypothetical protein
MQGRNNLVGLVKLKIIFSLTAFLSLNQKLEEDHRLSQRHRTMACQPLKRLKTQRSVLSFDQQWKQRLTRTQVKLPYLCQCWSEE